MTAIGCRRAFEAVVGTPSSGPGTSVGPGGGVGVGVGVGAGALADAPGAGVGVGGVVLAADEAAGVGVGDGSLAVAGVPNPRPRTTRAATVAMVARAAIETRRRLTGATRRPTGRGRTARADSPFRASCLDA